MSSLTNKIFPTRKIKLSDRLQVIQNAIVKKDSVIVDVGCDHCHTAISALDSRKAKFVFNIDNKKEPLINGIKNLTNAGFLSQAKNILADGLQTDQIDKKIDYCIISGLGGHKIAEIVKNKNADIQINEYIVVANDNPYFIRKFIYDNWLKIIDEDIISADDQFFFHFIKFGKSGTKIVSKPELFFGPINITKNTTTFKAYIKSRYEQLKPFVALTKNKLLIEEFNLLETFK